MNAQDIRNAYLKFFEDRGHKVIPRAPLVLQNDPTTLFTGSGMQQLMPFLLGQKHPEGTRLVDSQTCIRAQDIDEVGDNRHTTFFEMLGNWSLGDYFKAEQFPWMFEFLTEVVGLDPKKLYVTTFLGHAEFGIPKDTESGEIWKKLFESKGIEAGEAEIGTEADGYQKGMAPGVRIFYYAADKNWWYRGKNIADMPVGEPGGPSSEIFYEFDYVEHNTEYGPKCHPNCDCGRFVEIGNNVLMQYVRTEKGFEPLPNKNIDFGGGLERIAMAALDSSDAFKISILWPIVQKLEEISGKKYDSNETSMRVIADHLRGAAFLAVDGVVPSNKEQGYVMRRLMRRAIRFAFDLGVEQNFVEQVVPVIADMYEADFPEVKANRDKVIDVLVKEEKVFRQTLRKGLKEFDSIAGQKMTGDYDTGTTPPEMRAVIFGTELFRLYDTYGFPVELSVEEAFKRGIELESNWKDKFDYEMDMQRERSQTAAKGTFKGGLGGQSDIHKKYHTATHLMYQALRQVLGDHVVQHGSNITEERLRFDFSHPDKLTPEQIKQVEDIVNEQIQKDLKVSYAEYPTEQARGELGALGAFGDRYGDTVKVYKMIEGGAEKPFSFEICGGPHVDHTLQLAEDNKHFKIQKEESSSAGIRRIKAVLA
ncbi:MAG TPA: alanine--tRNA ligase [Candidatus Saccharimonadales bacterium]|nr:alanine--tRNA ligase [Candidatus Saccharimonadales bacterium]